MGIGTSIFLIALGAILTFALDASVGGINLDVVGWILMGAGVLGLIMTTLIWGRRRQVVTTTEQPVEYQPGRGAAGHRAAAVTRPLPPLAKPADQRDSGPAACQKAAGPSARAVSAGREGADPALRSRSWSLSTRCWPRTGAYLLGWNIGAAGGPDLPTYRSEVPHAPLNGVLRVAGRTPQDALAEARKRLHGVPRIWWVGPDSDAGTAAGLIVPRRGGGRPHADHDGGDRGGGRCSGSRRRADHRDHRPRRVRPGLRPGIRNPADGVAATIEREKAFTERRQRRPAGRPPRPAVVLPEAVGDTRTSGHRHVGAERGDQAALIWPPRRPAPRPHRRPWRAEPVYRGHRLPAAGELPPVDLLGASARGTH